MNNTFDSAGCPFNIDNFIAFSGGGNKTSEYGMIIGKVVDIVYDKKIVKYERFIVNYDSGKPIIKKKVFSKQFYKFVVVEPFPNVEKLFDMTEEEYNSFPISRKIAHWLHQGYYNDQLQTFK